MFGLFMAPQKYGRSQVPETGGIEQPPARLSWDCDTPVRSHRELDDVAIAPEPPARRLQIGRIDEQWKRSGGERRLRADARLGHGARPQLRVVFGGQPVDRAHLGETADPVD